MSVPTRAEAATHVDAPPEVVYALVADVTRMGEWSPECVSCAWLSDDRGPGARFKGRNRSGLARWSTVAEVLVAKPCRELSFATLHRGRPATKWTYTFEALDGATRLTESFEALHTPAIFALLERLVIRNRQQQLEAGMTRTLAAIKVAAEALRDESRRRKKIGRFAPHDPGMDEPVTPEPILQLGLVPGSKPSVHRDEPGATSPKPAGPGGSARCWR